MGRQRLINQVTALFQALTVRRPRLGQPNSRQSFGDDEATETLFFTEKTTENQRRRSIAAQKLRVKTVLYNFISPT